MPEEERQRWLALEYLLDEEARELFEDAGPAEQAALREQLWLLADPLYLVEGNDREAEQYARRTLIRIRESAENPYDLPWEEDLEELVARYGGEVGWERGRPARPPSGMLQDNRFIIGRHRPHGREFMPGGTFLADPAGIPVRAWEIEDRGAVDRIRRLVRAHHHHHGRAGGALPPGRLAPRGGGLPAPTAARRSGPACRARNRAGRRSLRGLRRPSAPRPPPRRAPWSPACSC